MRITRSLRFAASLLFVACGSTSSYDVCTATCDAAYRCLNTSQSVHQTCLQACSAQQAALAQDDQKEDQTCQNAPSRRQAAVACEAQACNQIAGCAAAIPACVPK